MKIKQIVATCAILTTLLALNITCAAENRPILIWNPMRLASGDSLRSILQSTGYQTIQTDSLWDYIDHLSNYTFFVIGGIGEYGEPKITPQMIQPYLADMISFLDNGGAMYWEGARSLIWQPDSLRQYFCFDIYWAIQDTTSFLCGTDTFFTTIDSLGYHESPYASDAISHNPNNTFYNVIAAPEAHWPPANTKASINTDGHFMVMVANFGWNKMHDELINTRAQLAQGVIQLLTSTSEAINDPVLPQEESALAQNYPNPFNTATHFHFTLLAPSRVTLTIYNSLGQMTAQLIDAELPAGPHQVIWGITGSAVSSGVYLAFFQNLTGQKTSKLKLTILK